MPPLPADSIHARACKLKCEKILTRPDFTLFRRVTLDGWTYVDAAKAAGISLWACYKRVERTQKKLRRAIEEHPERFF